MKRHRHSAPGEGQGLALRAPSCSGRMPPVGMGRGGSGRPVRLRPPRSLPGYPSRPMYTVLAVLQVFIAVGLIFLILLHSGKDAGMSGAFGVGTGGGGSTGGSLMERNLDRWTIIFAIVFVVNTFALLKI